MWSQAIAKHVRFRRRDRLGHFIRVRRSLHRRQAESRRFVGALTCTDAHSVEPTVFCDMQACR